MPPLVPLVLNSNQMDTRGGSDRPAAERLTYCSLSDIILEPVQTLNMTLAPLSVTGNGDKNIGITFQ